MHVGVFSFNTEYAMRADRLARAAEERGFESLWVPEHTHIPVPQAGEPADPHTGMPLAGNGKFFLPEEYRHMSDPFTTLAAAAAVTARLRLGTCVCLINQYHPISLAKQVATLDRLSDGRFIFGIGAGWNVVEMGHHGVKFDHRWPQLRERLSALRTLWANERASFNGKYVEFTESWQYPKPLHSAGPPVVLGTLDTPFGRSQVAQHGDGWLPLTFDVDETKRSIADIHAQMKTLGRNPDKLEVSLFFLADEIQSTTTLAKARDTGVARAILRLPVGDEVVVLKALDEYARNIQ
ncbi:MAG: TIGR03619 family F420-dependent LLM class oxidoreductase [Gammaproteobacteria bacterium]|nr:TIGR03619 family F420-dependent LLM class oxidoreductase [Gammaproteobacteria bacterium]